MPFDAKAFSKARFEPRTATLKIEELRDWFGGDEPVFTVRGLSGIELAQALESAQTTQSRAELAEALLDGTDGAKVDAVKEAFGLGTGVPDELIRYHELVIRGTVEPKLSRDLSVKLAERFPVDHKQLALRILALTGQGQAVKKKAERLFRNAEVRAGLALCFRWGQPLYAVRPDLMPYDYLTPLELQLWVLFFDALKT